ncbi:MAG: chemotaxis protein [Rhizobiales bacterium 32-66-8]|nr:MAG: chemotaxis protein [Rhizobiales bacterium 32-66-8]
MPFFKSQAASKLDAIERSQAVIEFEPSGKIITANENFLTLLGYRLEEVRGKHHSLFMPERERGTPAYQRFWDELASGKYQQAEFCRITKDGREVWIQGSYNPILGPTGKTLRVVKVASDITQQKQVNADLQSQINAINRVQAVIQFALDGTILDANQNFLETLGYSLEEIRGKHHSIFVDQAERTSPDYRRFWDRLREGEFQAAEFRRIAKSGQEVWIQASYNPIFDANGRIYKIVKFATDITEMVKERVRREKRRAIDSELKEISQAITSANGQAAAAASASHETSSSVQSVAAGAEELVASIREIGTQVTRSLSVAQDAVSQATRTNGVVSGLEDAAKKIGAVVQLITSIAGQTNLLALNATIEAARAGESGRGFAVVASEVKNLATQTAQATQEIANQITDVQASTTEAVAALTHITVTISQINDISSSIASAVEEQSSVTAEIARNMHMAAGGVGEITRTLSSLSSATAQIDAANQKVQRAQQEAA